MSRPRFTARREKVVRSRMAPAPPSIAAPTHKNPLGHDPLIPPPFLPFSPIMKDVPTFDFGDTLLGLEGPAPTEFLQMDDSEGWHRGRANPPTICPSTDEAPPSPRPQTVAHSVSHRKSDETRPQVHHVKPTAPEKPIDDQSRRHLHVKSDDISVQKAPAADLDSQAMEEQTPAVIPRRKDDAKSLAEKLKEASSRLNTPAPKTEHTPASSRPEWVVAIENFDRDNLSHQESPSKKPQREPTPLILPPGWAEAVAGDSSSEDESEWSDDE